MVLHYIYIHTHLNYKSEVLLACQYDIQLKHPSDSLLQMIEVWNLVVVPLVRYRDDEALQ